MNSKLLFILLFFCFILSGQLAKGQIRVIDNKGTLSTIDTRRAITGTATYVASPEQYTLSTSSAVQLGTIVIFTPTNANTTTTPLLRAGTQSMGVAITKSGHQTLVAGDIVVGVPVIVIFDGSNWVLQTPQGNSTNSITTIGAPSASYAAGASLSGNTLTMGMADATNPGMVSAGLQTFTGQKNFNSSTTVFGMGEGGTPTTTFIRGPQAGGSGTAGADLYIQASNGTGAGGSGNIIFQTGTAATVSVPTVSNVVNQTFASSNTHTLSGYTLPNGGTNKILMVEVNIGYNGPTVSSITYNGSALSPLGYITSSSNRMEIWYLVAPVAGTSKDIVLTLSGYAGIGLTAMTWTNVNQSTPFGTVVSVNNGYNSSASLLPASSLGQVVMDFLTTTTNPVTATAGQSVLTSFYNGSSCYNTSGYKLATAGTTTMSCSFGSSNYGYMAFAIRSSTSGGGNALSDALTINNSGNTVIAGGKSLAFADGSSNAVSLTAPSSVTTYKLTLPAGQGGGGQTLLNDGSGALSWGIPTYSYTLPIATTTTLGAVKVGSGLNMDVFGVISTANSGTVSSVGLSLPAEMTVSNTPITSTGTLTAAWVNQTANKFFAAPSSGSGIPMFRAIVASDIPTLNQNTTGTAMNVAGVVGVANGGTGSSTQNWVDLTTNQTAIGGAKTWNGLGTFSVGLTASGSAVSINDNSNFGTTINTGTSTGTVNIASGTTGGNAITIGNAVGATSLIQKVGTGNFSLDGVGASNYTIGNSTVVGTMTIGGTAQTGAITLGSSSAAQTVNVGNGAGASTVNIANGIAGNTVSIANGDNTTIQTVNIANGLSGANSIVNILSGIGTGGTGAINLGDNPRITTIDVGNYAPAAARTITIGGGYSGVVDQINIGTGIASTAGGKTINIGTGATTAAGGNVIHIGDGTPTSSGTNSVTIGSTVGASSTAINAGTGLILSSGTTVIKTPTPIAINATATATAAQMLSGVITTTSVAATTITTPTATAIMTLIQGGGRGTYFDLVIDNSTGLNTVTLALGTNIVVGTQAITGGNTLTVSTANKVGIFRFYFTSTTTAYVRRIF